MNPRPGDVVFVRGHGLIARAIRQITGGHYNHAEIYIGQGETVGAMTGEGVRRGALQTYKDDGEEYCFGRVVIVTDREANTIAESARSLDGTAYDLFGVFGIWIKFACKALNVRWIVFWGKNKISNGRKFWCSELVGHLYRFQGVRFTDEDISWLTPTEIAESQFIILFGDSNGK